MPVPVVAVAETPVPLVMPAKLAPVPLVMLELLIPVPVVTVPILIPTAPDWAAEAMTERAVPAPATVFSAFTPTPVASLEVPYTPVPVLVVAPFSAVPVVEVTLTPVPDVTPLARSP